MQIGLRAHDYGTGVGAERLAEILGAFAPASVQLAPAKSLADAPAPGRMSPGYARGVRKALEAVGVSIAVLGCYINPVHPDPDAREKHLRRFEEALRYARDFGCPVVGTETGSLNGDCSFHPDTEKPETFDLFCRSLERLTTTAEKCGSIVAIEAVADRHAIHSVEKMEAALRRLRSPALKVIYDPVNLVPRAGLRESQAEFFGRAFEAFGEEIVAIHAKDFRVEGGAKNGSLPAGTGDMDYPALMGLVMERKPGIDVLLENSCPATGREAMAFLRRSAGLPGAGS